ncbi:hypothetical protein KEJ51_00290 [Candidatus Bathyarchaeota archaeon]|nr:hypothetical protein [Candidatus Bathyarchaeota archaeon]MBS7628526.1 hypothetical protein [Candidatus Bathyarchaeota archaeon]
MSSRTTQRFVSLAIIVTLTISIWSGYLYSQAYRLSQESSMKLDEAKKSLEGATQLIREASSKLDEAKQIASEGKAKIDEANRILSETENLLKDIRRQGIIYINAVSVDGSPQTMYFAGEPLIAVRVRMSIASPSNIPIYYESKVVNPIESKINFSGATYSFNEYVKVTDAQPSRGAPSWSAQPTSLGTEVTELYLWIGLRSLPFQRKQIFLSDPKTNMTVGVELKMELLQAHTNLVLNQAKVYIMFEFKCGEASARLIDWGPRIIG